MRIESLVLQNFRCHENLTLAMAPLMVITGPNGSGKSSIQGALEYIIAGRCAWTDERGQGALGRGGQSGSVSLTAPTGSATRTTDGHLSLSWRPSAKTGESQRELEAELGCTADRARLSLRAGRFFGLDAKGQAGLLYELLNLAITPQAIQEELGKRNILARALTLGGILTDTGRMHKLAYEERTLVNRSIKQTKTALEAERAREESLVRIDDSYDTAARYELEVIEAEVREAKSKALSQEMLGRMMQELVHELGNAETAYDKAKADMESCFAQPVSKPVHQIEDSIRIAKQKLQLIAAEIEEITRARVDCPECGQPYAGENREKLQALELRQGNGNKVVSDLTWGLAHAQKRANLQERVDHGAAWVSRVEERIATARAGLVAPSPTVYQGQLDRAKELMDVRVDYAAWDNHVKVQSKLSNDLTKLEAEAHDLNDLVAFYSPTGYQADVLRDRLGPFQDQVNGYLDRWSIQVRFGASLEILGSRSDRDGVDHYKLPFVPYAALSDGEQVLVALAFQAAFAHLTGLRIVVVDRIEALDERNQRHLMAAALELVSVEEGPDHILLMGVRAVDSQGAVRIELGRVEVAA